MSDKDKQVARKILEERFGMPLEKLPVHEQPSAYAEMREIACKARLTASEAALDEARQRIKWLENHNQHFRNADTGQIECECCENVTRWQAERALKAPYWQCICGAKAMPLTDDTQCDCQDIYSQEWNRISKEPAELEQQVTQQAATISQLQSTLETIADLAPGYGDVCELIARRARVALASIPKEPVQNLESGENNARP